MYSSVVLLHYLSRFPLAACDIPHSVLVHLSRHGAEVGIFAPDIPQMHVIDHCKGEPTEGETR